MRHTILRTAAAPGLVALVALVACRDRPRSPTEPLPAAIASVSAADAAPGDADAAAPLRPAEGDRVLFDVRESLQSAGDVDAAVALWNLRDAPRHWAFTSDADGAGTHAMRVDWPSKTEGCSDAAPVLSAVLPSPHPQRIYVQWKQRMGRTPSGGGYGELGAFELTNPLCPREGRMVGMLTRKEGSADDRVELRWLGPPPVTPWLKVKDRDVAIAPTEGWTFLPQEHVGEVIEHTLYAQAESQRGAHDGVVRLWVNGRLLAERTGLKIGTRTFRRFHLPWTMVKPQARQTEYFWDVVAWTAPAVSAAFEPAAPALDVGGTMRLTATARDAIGSPVSGIAERFESSDPSIATVAIDGTVTGVEPGETIVTATLEGLTATALVTVRGTRRTFHVAPDGTPGGRGTRASPWDLATALAGGGGLIGPGAVVWVHGGTYRSGDRVFVSTLVGAPEAPVVVRAVPGERATIDGQLLVEAQGSDVTFWGLELMQSNPLDGDLPTLRALAPGGRYINLVIHDAGENGVSLRSESGYSELYGSIVYDNGNDEHLDQGVYAPNDAGEKRITDNVFFNNIASGIQVYGTPNHPILTDVWVEGNISFNNSSIASMVGEENATIGGATITDRVFVLGNLLYYAGASGQNLRFGLEGKDNRNAVVRDNYVVGGSTVVRSEDFASAIVENNTFIGTARMARLGGASLAGHRWAGNVYYRDPAAKAWNWNGKLYDFEGFRAATGLGATDRAIAELPTEPMIFVRPNRYEAGRAHIAVVNWGRAASVAVDVSAVLRQGDRWELRNVQDVFGPPVASGTYGGGPIHVPLTGVEPPPAAGRPGRPERTAPDFDAFLLTITPRG